MQTDLFNSLDDFVQVVIYASVYIAALITGVKIVQIGGLLRDAWKIITNNSLTPEEKITQITPLAIQMLGLLGVAFEMLNEEQGTSPKIVDNI
jgi:hypothetical protein